MREVILIICKAKSIEKYCCKPMKIVRKFRERREIREIVCSLN